MLVVLPLRRRYGIIANEKQCASGCAVIQPAMATSSTVTWMRPSAYDNIRHREVGHSRCAASSNKVVQGS